MHDPRLRSEKRLPLLNALGILGVSALLWWGIISGGAHLVTGVRHAVGF